MMISKKKTTGNHTVADEWPQTEPSSEEATKVHSTINRAARAHWAWSNLGAKLEARGYERKSSPLPPSDSNACCQACSSTPETIDEMLTSQKTKQDNPLALTPHN